MSDSRPLSESYPLTAQPGSPKCDACKVEVWNTYWKSPEHGTHCDVCYRLVVLGFLTPDGKRK